MYSNFFSVHFSFSYALCFVSLSPSLKIYNFYFDKTEKSKRTSSFLPKIREVEPKIISLYEHENTLSFYTKIEDFIAFLAVLFMLDDFMQY